MRISINYCINCGVEYKFQASGNIWTLPYSKSYNDKDYCPDCKQAIIFALEKIPKVTIKKWAHTNLVNKETLDRWEKEEDEEHNKKKNLNKYLFPLLKRVFSPIYNIEKKEILISKEVEGREQHDDKLFRYSYYESNKECCDIKVLTRRDINGNFVKYELKE